MDSFGFERRPFLLTPEIRNVFWTKGNRFALEELRSGVDRLAPILLLTGASGTGKTTLLEAFVATAPEEAIVGWTSFPAGAPQSIWGLVLAAFSLPVTENPLGTFYSFLASECDNGRRCILIVDESQALSDGDLDALRQLTNVNVGDRMLFQIILAGQPELRDRLKQPGLRQLATRIGVHHHLRPFEAEETSGYVRSRLEGAGGDRNLFDAGALSVVHDASGGVPRTINVVCDHLLTAAARRQACRVDAALAESVTSADDGPILFSEENITTSEASSSAVLRADPEEVAAEIGSASSPEVVTELASYRPWAGASAATPDHGPARAAFSSSRIGAAGSARAATAKMQHEPVETEARIPEPPASAAEVPIHLLAVRALSSLPEYVPEDQKKKSEKSAEPVRRTIPETDTADNPSPRLPRKSGLWVVAGAICVGGTVALIATQDLMPFPSPPLNVTADAAPTDTVVPDAPRVLQTPSLPTIASDTSDMDELYDIALDLSFVDPTVAAVSFSRAALRGHARAGYYLAQLYETGDGVPANPSLARAWYARVAEEQPSAARRLAEMDEVSVRDDGKLELLSASRLSDGTGEFVWASNAAVPSDGFIVEIGAEPQESQAMRARSEVSAARVALAEDANFWRVRAVSTVSDWQRIPP